MKELNYNRALEILNFCKGKIVAIIGDVMLDRYFWGSVSRISPESPVPIVDLEVESFHLGGAANVANNLISFGIKPFLCGVIGDDNSGSKFKEIAIQSGIDISGIYIDKDRPTTVKTRIIGNNQHIARLDREVRTLCGDEYNQHVLNSIMKIDSLTSIIIQDYNKGAVTNELIYNVINYAKEKNIPIFVDPKYENFFQFNGVYLFKPNRKEAEQALNTSLKTREQIIHAGRMLLERLNCNNVLLTMGKDGMMLFESNGSISEVPTRARHIADVSGAGDTAIATLSAAYAGGANVKEASAIANYAAGTVCEKPGIVAVNYNDILESILYNSK